MARIGIVTCSNCAQETNCSSVVCLADMRKRKGRFDRYPADEALDLVGLVHCAGCPTAVAPAKILKRIRSLVDYRIDALHFSYCMTVLCPFIGKYEKAIRHAFPDLAIVHGTHQPADTERFKRYVKELLCPTVRVPQDMNDVIQRTLILNENHQSEKGTPDGG